MLIFHFGFIMSFEECANQGIGVLGGHVWKQLIFHCVLLCCEQGLGEHGICEMGHVDLLFGFTRFVGFLRECE